MPKKVYQKISWDYPFKGSFLKTAGGSVERVTERFAELVSNFI
jgi:hypothetical protein